MGFRAVWSKDSSHTNIMTCVLARPSASSAYGATGAYGARPVGQIIWQRTALRNCMPDIIICDPNKAVEGHIYQGPASRRMCSTANETRRLSLLGQLLTTGFSQSTRSNLQNLARCHLTQRSTPQHTFSTHVMAQQLACLIKSRGIRQL